MKWDFKWLWAPSPCFSDPGTPLLYPVYCRVSRVSLLLLSLAGVVLSLLKGRGQSSIGAAAQGTKAAGELEQTEVSAFWALLVWKLCPAGWVTSQC